MVLENTSWIKSPVFLGGLALRAGLIVFLVPAIQESWFLPFFQFFLKSPGLDPWTSFISSGGDKLSFPYGPAMFLVHLPYVALGQLLDSVFSTGFLTGLGFRLSLFMADTVLLILLLRLFPRQTEKILVFYWLSPIVIFVTYWHGQTDIVPVALFVLALVFLNSHNGTGAGVALGASLSAKLSMAVGIPFIAIFLWRNKKNRPLIPSFCFGLLIASLVGLGIELLSPGFREMVLGSREMGRLFHLALPFGDVKLYLAPILFGCALYATWRLTRMSFDLMLGATGLSFFLLVLTTPAPPGWYLWLVPFFVAHQIKSRPLQAFLTFGFSLLVVGYHLIISPGAFVPAVGLGLSRGGAETLGVVLTPHQKSVWISAIAMTGLVILIQMLRERIYNNDYFRISKRPISIAIGGDSAAGKDTLASSLSGLFCENAVAHVSGDDYHLWDRYAPMWKTLTHLNPRANDLGRFIGDVDNVLSGRPINVQPYDHGTGRFFGTRRVDSNDVVIVSGLHALYDQNVASRFDISIFLKPTEELRRYWKGARDVGQRGHTSASIDLAMRRRRNDAIHYIDPQIENAGIVFELSPNNLKEFLENQQNNHPLKLSITMRDSIDHEKLARALIGLCGMHIDTTYLETLGCVQMTTEGDLEADDAALVAEMIAPRMTEILRVKPKWASGMLGVMQLVVLMQLETQLRRRR